MAFKDTVKNAKNKKKAAKGKGNPFADKGGKSGCKGKC